MVLSLEVAELFATDSVRVATLSYTILGTIIYLSPVFFIALYCVLVYVRSQLFGFSCQQIFAISGTHGGHAGLLPARGRAYGQGVRAGMYVCWCMISYSSGFRGCW